MSNRKEAERLYNKTSFCVKALNQHPCTELHDLCSSCSDSIKEFERFLDAAEQRGKENAIECMCFALEELEARPELSQSQFYVMKDGKKYIEPPDKVCGYLHEILRHFRERFSRDFIDDLERFAYQDGKRAENAAWAKTECAHCADCRRVELGEDGIHYHKIGGPPTPCAAHEIHSRIEEKK